MSCSLCPSTQIHPDDSKRNAGSAAIALSCCWFGEEGLYHWQPVKPQRQKREVDSWVFGLEDQFFPLSPPEAEPAESPSAVDGLTDEFLQFLEKRLADVDDETEDDTVLPDLPVIKNATAAAIEAAKPIPPIRRRRVQRSVSLQAAKVTPPPLIRGRNVVEYADIREDVENVDQEFHQTRRLSRGGSIASDLIQRVKRWAAVTSTFRRAFRKVGPHQQVPLQMPLSAVPTWSFILNSIEIDSSYILAFHQTLD